MINRFDNSGARTFGINPLTGLPITGVSPYMAAQQPTVGTNQQTTGMIAVNPNNMQMPVVPEQGKQDGGLLGSMGAFNSMIGQLAKPGIERMNRIDAARQGMGMEKLGFMDRLRGITGFGDQPQMPIGAGGMRDALNGIATTFPSAAGVAANAAMDDDFRKGLFGMIMGGGS